MPPRPAERDRWLALGLLAGLLLLAYLVFVHPWWTMPMRELDARIADLRTRELRLRTQLRQAPEVELRLARVQADLRGRPGFLPESTPELATAGLIQRLETVAAQASPGNRSCAITNRSPLESARAGRFQRVTVQVRLRCGVPELASILHALETGQPRTFVENLDLLAQRSFGLPGQARSGGPGGVDVSFDLTGYIAQAQGAARAP